MKLDEIMCGRNGQIIEIVGETGTGKTQFAHLMAIKQAINTKGFTVYIDSGGNFAPKRLVQLCKPFTLDENVVKDLLRRIIWIQCFQKSDLELALQELNDGMGLNIELIIIDSMRSILGSVTEIVGHNNLRTLAKKLNTPILTINESKQFETRPSVWSPSQKLIFALSEQTKILRDSILGGQEFIETDNLIINIECVGIKIFKNVKIGRFSIN